MLPAEARLRRRTEFDLAVRRGRRAGGRLVSVHLLLPPVSTPEQARARVGFVVGRAVGGAVLRNRVRRQLRHAVRPLLAHLPTGALLVVRAHPAAVGARFADLEADLRAALARASSRRHAVGR